MAKFEIFRDARGDYHWRLRSAGGRISAIGGEGFTTKAGAENSIAAVRRDMAAASVVETSASPVPTAAASSRMEPGMAKKKLPPSM